MTSPINFSSLISDGCQLTFLHSGATDEKLIDIIDSGENLASEGKIGGLNCLHISEAD
jgi:hypothetical protein